MDSFERKDQGLVDGSQICGQWTYGQHQNEPFCDHETSEGEVSLNHSASQIFPGVFHIGNDYIYISNY